MLAPDPVTLDQQARERLRAWIDSTGITQAEVATRIGRNQAWVSRYLKGDFDADLETLQSMARTFGHELIALLDLPKDPFEARVLDEIRALPIKSRPLFLDLLASLRQSRSHKGRAKRK